MKVRVTAEAHNEEERRIPDRPATWKAWMRENGIPSKDIAWCVYDTDTWTFTANRRDRRPFECCPCSNPEGHVYGEAMKEPETYRYYTDPADWMLACGEVVE